MNEKIKVSVTVPENLTGMANQFLQSITFPTPRLDGVLSPPPLISVERGSRPLGDYVIESLKIRPLGIDTGGTPRATAVEVVAIPIKPMRIEAAGDGEIENYDFVCPECKTKHSRGPLDPLSKVYRCLKCGYVGPKVEGEPFGCLTCDGSGWERWPERGLARVCPSCERCPECGGSGVGNTPGALACEDVCTKCGGKGRVRKDEPGPMGMRGGEVEKGPVDESVTVENEEEFKGEFGDGETFPSDPKKQELKRRILDRMTARDMVDAISDGCDLPNLADIIINLFPEEEILDITSSVVIEKDKETFGESKLPSALLSAKGVAELKDRFEERHRGTENNDCPECLGTGKKFIGEPDERDCERCDGTGRATEREGENR